ncbi:glycosyltransferase family 9 protein [Edaphobacter bradus]|uniref:glycosyltransferase family 9 protein n=1 Tax=Edaphobacter bradus TaxID=2259016 RepID=UPI0021E0B991|nr:glycosyltransferase family 9 protein [Edaphobacter bradus]
MRKALLIKFGAIGDVIMLLPAARALYESGAHIDWVCGSMVQPLLECYSWISLLPADDRKILTGNPWERMSSIADLWRRVSGERYDLCATLYYDDRYKFLSLPVRAAKKLTLSRSSRDRLLIPGRNHADEYARILLGKDDGWSPESIAPIRPDRLPGPPPLPEKSRTRVALVPAGASNMLRQQALRRWSAESYAELAKVLLARGWEVVLLGGPDDAWVRPYFESLAVKDCIGALTLPQVIMACDQCDVVVSHDTGPLHLAGLSHAAIVGLFGPTDPGNFLPRRPYVTGIWGGVNFACRPCYDGRNFAPCKHNGCMEQISTQLVMREIDSLLERKAAGLASPPRLILPEV